jgi:hypothetical protein
VRSWLRIRCEFLSQLTTIWFVSFSSRRGDVLTTFCTLNGLLFKLYGIQGVWESDPIRKDDSFETFEEIFKIAHAQKVDFVLLGGDLFHENKPSRNTVVKAMDILAKYCMNNDDIGFEILSDQKNLFTTGCVLCGGHPFCVFYEPTRVHICYVIILFF